MHDKQRGINERRHLSLLTVVRKSRMASMLSMCGGDEEEQAICSFGMLVDCANTAMVE